jgi:DNA-binding NtrC family response regulator
MLSAYEWPGNVRELENIIERSVALSCGTTIRLKDVPLDLAFPDESHADDDRKRLSIRTARKHFERQFILRALEQVDWNQTRAARLLGLHRNTLLQKLAAYGIKRDPLDEPSTP